jgi:RNA polymerase sigma-70 factor (ECF subfamily)
MHNDMTDDLIPTRRSLLTRLKDWDDQEGWKRFFDTYWKLIHGVAVKSGLTDAEAQDAVQETVIEVAKRMHEFKYDPALGSFKGWLCQLTRWKVVGQFRRRQRDLAPHARTLADPDRTATVERLPDPESLDLDSLWEEEWRKNLIDAALRRLKRKANAKDFQIFHFYVLREWPVQEVVETLGVSADQVYQAKSRILPLLTKEVEYLETQML